MRARTVIFVVASAAINCPHVASAAEVGYITEPALYGEQLVFVSEGDLWTVRVPETGDEPIIAHRLTSGDGDEGRPVFSADGQRIAFAGEYDGNTDVYVMPAEGGAPRRLTFHPDPDVPLGWTGNDRRVLFSSPRRSPLRRPELHGISIAGGMPEHYPFGECTMLASSASGRRIAFNRWSTEGWTWKRYRGGAAPEIWMGDLDATGFRKLTDDPGSDQFPMWMIGRIFFVSDRTGTANIFSDTPQGGDLQQHTSFAPVPNPAAIDGFDVRWPSADAQRRGRRIVFCQAGRLALLDGVDNTLRRLDVRLASDRVARRQRFADLLPTATRFALSPSGDRLLIESRGEMMIVPIEPGAAVQLPRTGDAREWGGAFLDAERIVMVTDLPGEQQIAVSDADGSDRPALLTSDRQAWLFPPVTSRDGRQIAFGDKTGRLHVLDLQTLERRQIDMADAGEITDYRFSPDSRWLAYALPTANGGSAVRIASLETRRTFNVSGEMHADRAPRWDPAGVYLYMLSSRRFDPVLDEHDYDSVAVATSRVVAVPLTLGTPPPVAEIARAAGMDPMAWADAPPPGAAPDADADAPEPDAMQIDTDGLAERHAILPLERDDAYPVLEDLEAIPGGLVLLEAPIEGVLEDDDEVGSGPGLASGRAQLVRYDLVTTERTVIAEDVEVFELSGDAGTLAYPLEEGAFEVRSVRGAEEARQVDVEALRVRIDAPAEWRHIFLEAWRLQRDFYFAENMAGVDWDAVRARYEPLLAQIGTRDELNDLIGQMIGELGTSHAYVWGGDRRREAQSVEVGLLGADFEPAPGGVRVLRVVPDLGWDERYRSPLGAAHLQVQEGDILESVDGMPLAPGVNLFDLLHDRADRLVRLTFSDDGAQRTVVVRPVADDRPARYAAWVDTNRRYVQDASGGRIGYVHLPDMGGEGLSLFARQFYPQFDRPAMIIDVRDNNGGFVSQMVLERLSRRLLGFFAPRHGTIERYPRRAPDAHMVALIDEHAGSDGDIFPAAFRMLGLGPLIGTRTWGGVVGVRGDKPFVDMGLSTQPEYAWWDEAGGWSIENRGVEPDIEVPITPNDRVAGKDVQLERAVAHLLQALEADPREMPERPANPVR